MVNSDCLLDKVYHKPKSNWSACFDTNRIYNRCDSQIPERNTTFCTTVHAQWTYSVVNIIISELLPTLCRVMFTTYIHPYPEPTGMYLLYSQNTSPRKHTWKMRLIFSAQVVNCCQERLFWPHDFGNHMTKDDTVASSSAVHDFACH